LGFISHHYQY